MVYLYIRRYRNMIMAGIFFFYLGCGIILSFLRIECTEALSGTHEKSSYLSSYDYAVLVISGPDNELKRDAIRATWGKFTGNVFSENGEILYKWNHTWTESRKTENLIKFYFVIGTQGLSETKLLKLKTENNRSNDLLLLDNFEDSYKNLAVKILHAWISEHMKGLKCLIKCDDDSFVRVNSIVKNLEAYAPHMNAPELSSFVSFRKNRTTYKGLFWGYFIGHAKVFSTGKWKETNWFLCDKYLPYALGGGYVISRSIIGYIAKNSDDLSYYNSEDVSMGVWTAPLDNINRVHDIRFDTEWQSRGCSNHMLVRHKQSPTDMFKLYKELVHSHGNKLCETKKLKKVGSYLYKWNALPSMCCNIGTYKIKLLMRDVCFNRLQKKEEVL